MIEDREETIIRGGQAAGELTLTEDVIAKLRAGMLEKIAGSTTGQRELREAMYFGVQALDAVRKALMDAVASGNHAAALDEMAAIIERH